MNVVKLRAILLIGLATILVACQPSQIKPTKPTLKVIPQVDGGICLSKEDSAKLGIYIMELERR